MRLIASLQTNENANDEPPNLLGCNGFVSEVVVVDADDDDLDLEWETNATEAEESSMQSKFCEL